MKSKILIEALTKLRSELPHGAIERVRRKRRVSRTFMDRLFDESTSISEKGYMTIEDLKNEVEREKEKAEKVVVSINKTLSK